MDASVASIAEYSSALRFNDIPSAVVHECKRRVIDTLGCGLGAFDAEPSRFARNLAMRVSTPNGACVLGTAHRTLPELAAFANGVMNRYLDGNDGYFGATGGAHGSDNIAPTLAAADAVGAHGKTVITAVVLAYEVFHAMFRGVSMRDKGMDHVFYTAVGSAVGAAKALGLNQQQMEHAVSLAITPNIPLGATRRGALSMWKACAAANAARNGMFAALCAAEGITGPDKPIEGAHGLRELVDKFELTPFAGDGRPFRMLESNMKYHLAVGQSQAPIAATLQFQPRVAAEDVESLTIYTYWAAWSESGSEPEKWHPTTRETADHSLPWIVAAVLIDGGFSDEIFSPERLADQRIHRLTDRITVKEEPEFSRLFPGFAKCRIEIVTKNGEHRTSAVDYGRGHPKNPMTDDEVNTKFRNLAGRALPKARVESALEQLWRLDEAANLGEIFKSLRIDA